VFKDDNGATRVHLLEKELKFSDWKHATATYRSI